MRRVPGHRLGSSSSGIIITPHTYRHHTAIALRKHLRRHVLLCCSPQEAPALAETQLRNAAVQRRPSQVGQAPAGKRSHARGPPPPPPPPRPMPTLPRRLPAGLRRTSPPAPLPRATGRRHPLPGGQLSMSTRQESLRRWLLAGGTQTARSRRYCASTRRAAASSEPRCATCSGAQHSAARHITAWHITAWHSVVQPSI